CPSQLPRRAEALGGRGTALRPVIRRMVASKRQGPRRRNPSARPQRFNASPPRPQLFFLRKAAKVILVRIEGVPAAGIRDDAVGGRGLVEGRGEVSDVRTRSFQALADHRVCDLYLEDAQGGQDLINLVLVEGRGGFVRGPVFGSLVDHAGLLPGCWARRLSA